MSESKVSVSSIGTPQRWYIAKTLLGCGPGSDVNRRLLYHNDHAVVTFNQRMAEWHSEDNEALTALCGYLNKLRAAVPALSDDEMVALIKPVWLAARPSLEAQSIRASLDFGDGATDAVPGWVWDLVDIAAQRGLELGAASVGRDPMGLPGRLRKLL